MCPEGAPKKRWLVADRALSRGYSGTKPLSSPTRRAGWHPASNRRGDPTADSERRLAAARSVSRVVDDEERRVASVDPVRPRWLKGEPRNWQGDGFDSETYQGWARLLCTSQDHAWIERGDYGAAFDFLLDTGPRLAAWNLRFDAEAVLKHLGEAKLHRLFATESLNVGKYRVQLIPWKMLRVEDEERRTEIFDVAPFFGSKLDVAAKRFLGEGKLEVDAARLNVDPAAWKGKEQRARIVEYCKRDARLTNDLARQISERFVKLGGDFRRPYSVAFVAADILMREAWIPKLPEPLVEPAELAFRGARFECLQRGRFEYACAYDIKSAYPGHLRDVEDSKGVWIKSKHPKGDALHAIIRARATVPPDEYPIMAPLPVDMKGRLVYPTGTFETWVLLKTYRKWEHLLEPLESWSFIPRGEVIKPYRDVVDKLLSFREESDALLKDAAKRGNNSIYGKLLNQRTEWKLVPDETSDHWTSEHILIDGVPHRRERVRKRGLLYHPLHAGLVTEGTRLQIWDACKSHEKDVLMIQADGVISRRAFLGKEKAKRAGDLGFVAEGDTLVAGSGLYEIRGYARRTRGVMFHSDEGGKGKGKSVKLKGKSWFGLLRGVRTETVRFVDVRPAHLGECLRGASYKSTMGEERSLGLKDANVFLPFTRDLNVCRDEKREWPEILEARRLLHERFKSKPLTIRNA